MSPINDIPPPLYPQREGSHLRETLQTLLSSEYLHTFRDPTSPDWEIPPGQGEHWTHERWTCIGEHVTSTFAAAGWNSDTAHAGDHPGTTGAGETNAVWWWALRALQAWEAGDRSARAFVRELATVRLDVWSHGDKRRGTARERAAREVGDLRFDAATCDTQGRCPRALELAREIQVYRTSEQAHVTRHTRSNDGDRIAQALLHAGSALAGMCAARRLWDREAWLGLTRRALLAIAAAWTAQEALLAQHSGVGYRADDRKAIARAMVLLTLTNRARRLRFEPETEPDEGRMRRGPASEAAFRGALAALASEGWHPVIAYDGLEAAAFILQGRETATAIRDVAAAPPEMWAQWARAARLRGFEHDGLGTMTPEAFDPHYSAVEAEDMAPGPLPKRTTKGQPKGGAK